MSALAESSVAVVVPTPHDRGRAGVGPPWWMLLPAFVLVAFWMTFRAFDKLDTHVVGDSGDSLLILWILGWVQEAIPHGWNAVWNTSMFHPVDNTLAYSDSLISVALVQWPLRLFLGPELSFNLIALAAQTATLWFSYRLALALTRSWPASLVAALMFAFSTPLLSQLNHYQLTLTAFLVPLTLLLLVRYLEEFRVRYGIGIGLAFGALTTSATYYGLMMAIGVTVVVIGYLIWFRPRELWLLARGLLAGAAVAFLVTLPLAVQYMDLQRDPYFRRSFEPAVAAHPSDFLSPDGASYVTAEIPVLETNAANRGIENHLYPGLFTVAFACVGLVVLLRGLRSPAADRAPPEAKSAWSESPPTRQWTSRITLLVGLAGIASVILAFGDEVEILGHTVWMPFKVLRKFVPGFSGLRATSRFALLGQCALALFAAFGVRTVLLRLGRRAGAALVVVLCALVLVEAARDVPLVDVPDSRADVAAAELLARFPEGVVAELPIRGASDGAAWAFTEAPRQLVALADGNDRVNGYSGYSPPGFDALVPTFNAFPSAESLDLLDERDVRYVILRTRVLGDQPIGIDVLLDQDGTGRFTDATAKAKIAEIPPERLRRVVKVPGAYVIELRPVR